MPSVALAGYTNAGKSSLLNRLAGADVLVDNALFATLDPTVRRAETADGREYTLADTVGFVRHLPHQLIEAFRSTLEEVGRQRPDRARRRRRRPRSARPRSRRFGSCSARSTRSAVPEQLVFNKIDAVDEDTLAAAAPAPSRRAVRVGPHGRRDRRRCTR